MPNTIKCDRCNAERKATLLGGKIVCSEQQQHVLTCPKCGGTLHHASGNGRCLSCKANVVKLTALLNTNRKRGEDRGFDASDEAHGITAKGSHGGAVKRR
jgi:hypothetical protein